MKFGKVLRIEANLRWNTRWADYYVNYKQLKSLVNVLLKTNAEINNQLRLPAARAKAHADDTIHEVPPKVPVVHVTNSATENIRDLYFKQAVTEEFQKVKIFLRDYKRVIETKVNALPSVESSEAGPNTDIGSPRYKLVQLLDRLIKFASINHDAFTKILKKYAKKVVAAFPDCHDLEPFFHSQLKVVHDFITSTEEVLLRLKEESKDLAVEESVEEQSTSIEEVVWDDEIPTVTELALGSIQPGTTKRFWLVLGEDALRQPIRVPVIVVKGKFKGPVLGVTSALHGNELNGIPLLHQIVRFIDVEVLSGSFVAVPVLNPPGYFRRQRGFHDGQDLNRLFPGSPTGNCGQQYVHMITEKLLSEFDFHVDLHTASFGRVNSFYIRADMNHAVAHQMAMEQCSQIIVHNTATDGSLRHAAMARGVPSITLEIGNPQTIHQVYQRAAYRGMKRLLDYLQMFPLPNGKRIENLEVPTVCTSSKWYYSTVGGLLTIRPDVNQWLEKGEVYAQVRDLFGDVVATYRAPTDGIVVGKSSNPACNAGDRLIHLGVVGECFPSESHDGHT